MEPNKFMSNQIILNQWNQRQRKSLIAETNDRENLSNTLNNYITVLDHAHKTLLVQSGAGSSVSSFLFTAVIKSPVGIASASASLVFLFTNKVAKMFLKILGKKKINTEKSLSWPEVN